MTRILCWLNLHRWITDMTAHADLGVTVQVCSRCDRLR